MKLRITPLDFGRVNNLLQVRYIIEIKRHWWSKWEIRDWYDKGYNLPRFYESLKEAESHL